MVDVDQPQSAWRAVYRDLRDQIEDGRLPPGEQLPTLAQLADWHGVSTHGARKIMSQLRADGRVESWRGFGHRVAEPRVVYHLSRCARFGANMERIGRAADSRLLATRTVCLPQRFAEDMRLRPGVRVIQTEMLRLVEDRPFALAQSYFPMKRFRGIDETLDATRSVSSSLSRFGVGSFSRERTRIDVRMPNAHESVQLRIPSNQPVFVTVGRNIDEQGEVVEVTHTVTRGDFVSFEV